MPIALIVCLMPFDQLGSHYSGVLSELTTMNVIVGEIVSWSPLLVFVIRILV